jgi:acetolactate synthase-1/2/3 large subunit
VPEQIMRAYALAMNGRPGPVVVGLPEDMLTQEVDGPPRKRSSRRAASCLTLWRQTSPPVSMLRTAPS